MVIFHSYVSLLEGISHDVPIVGGYLPISWVKPFFSMGRLSTIQPTDLGAYAEFWTVDGSIEWTPAIDLDVEF